MATLERVVQTKNAIFHGLPTFSADLRGLSIIVTGANGISGDYMLRVLSESPERWSKIYAMSRRQPADTSKWGSNVEFIAADFLQSPQELANQLREKGVQADYAMFFSCVQPPQLSGRRELWTDLFAMAEINGRLLSNFLAALDLASIKPRRFLLQTGAKTYGLHLGPARTPQYEDTPRVTLETNFYYKQEDIMYEYCKAHNTAWNTIRPAAITGAVQNTAMDIVYPLAIYATVLRHQGKPLIFPGDHRAWAKEQTKSSAMLNSYLSEWAILTPEAANEAFNATDGGPFSWAYFWEHLAAAYGMEYTPPDPDAEYQTIRPIHKVPPRGFGPQETIRCTYTFTQWGRRPDVQQAWRELLARYNLSKNPFDNLEEFFRFPDLSVLVSWNTALSPTKARKLGFFGFVESIEPMLQSCRELAEMNLTPPLNI